MSVALAGLVAWSMGCRQLTNQDRTDYFNKGRAHAPRVLEELGPLPAELREASGVAVSRTQPGVVWSHNDSGNAPNLYAIDLKGRLLATVSVADVEARDWEDLSEGPCPGDAKAQQCLYIADSGNNDRSREILTIFVVVEPSISGATPAQPLVVRAQSFRYRYPNMTEDAEALAVLPNGDVTIVTKGRTPEIAFFGLSQADIARGIMSGDVLAARYQGDTGIMPNQGLGRWVTAAAISPDGTTLAVRTYSEIFFYSAETRANGRRWRNLNRPCFLGDVEPQGEAIDFLDENTLLLASETSQGRPGTLHRVQC